MLMIIFPMGRCTIFQRFFAGMCFAKIWITSFQRKQSNLGVSDVPKKQTRGDGERIIRTVNYDKRISGGGETSKNVYNPGKGRGAMYEIFNPDDCDMGDVRDVNCEEYNEKPGQQIYYSEQWEPNVIFPTKTQKWKQNHQEDCADSVKSEEEAATTIQAVYRGYKARRQCEQIRRSSSDEKQKARRVAELLAIPVGKNLHKPLEPVKISTSLANQGENEKDIRLTLSPKKKRRNSPIVRNSMQKGIEEQKSSSTRDLEGLRFDVLTAPQPTPRSARKSRPTDLPVVKSSTNLVDITKPIKTIKSPSFFHHCDERPSSVSPSENTDTEDPFSPRIEEKSMVDLQTRDLLYHNMQMFNNDHLHLATSDHRPRPRARDIRMQRTSNFKRQLPQRMSTSVLGTDMDNFFLDNSLFFPEREAVLVFGGIDPHEEYGCTGNTGKDMYRFKPSENTWEFVGEIPEPRHHHSVVYLKGRIYLVGGADPREDDLQRKSMVVGTVWSYDPTTRAWFSEPGMLTPRKNFGLIVSHGKMYAMGGQDRNGIALRTVEAFDPTDCIWREMQPMYTARVGPASAKYQDLVWVAGGMTKSKKEPLSREVECYDPIKNLWLKAEPLRSPRCFASMYVVSDCLYVIGGAGKTSNTDNITESIDTIDIWDPNLCVWRQQAEMSIARHGHSTGCIGDQLLIMGGVTTVYMRTLKSVECYCCDRDKWIKGVSTLPFAISGHGTVSLPPANLLAES